MSKFKADDQITQFLIDQGLIEKPVELPALPVGLIDLAREWIEPGPPYYSVPPASPYAQWIPQWIVLGMVAYTGKAAQNAAERHFDKLMGYARKRASAVHYGKVDYHDRTPLTYAGNQPRQRWQAAITCRIDGYLEQDIVNILAGLYDA